MKSFIKILIVLCLFLLKTAIVTAQQPTITSFTPNSGAIGTLVTITGKNIGNTTSISIGGVTAIKVSNNGDTVVAMVMPNAITGAVSLSTLRGSYTSSNNFNVRLSSYPDKQVGNKLVDPQAISQGNAVAISADGNTAVIGGNGDNNGTGAIWVYIRKSDSTWIQQGQKLVGSGSVTLGTISVFQGWSVAISADGNTIVEGGLNDSANKGAVWVFTRNNGKWTQQGNKLVGAGSIGNDVRQGCSVSISADGNTILFGGANDNSIGAAWIFVRTSNVWKQQGNKLVGTGGIGSVQYQGRFVALSADGNTAIISNYLDSNNCGASWIFVRNDTIWAQEGNKLVGVGGTPGDIQGYSVALSADGNTAIVGAQRDNKNEGAAFIFFRTGKVWAQQGGKIVGSGSVFGKYDVHQGYSVSISADGNTAIVGGYADADAGAVWVFGRSNGAWKQLENKLVVRSDSSIISGLGTSVAISADGSTIIVGGASTNKATGTSLGGAWIFGTSLPLTPSILSFTPNSTCPGTSIPVFITGANFTKSITAVTVGGAAVDSFTVNDSSSITAYISKGTTGKIAVIAPNGTATSDSVFTFGIGHTAYAYITNQDDGTVSVINTVADTVSATITVGSRPLGVGINPAGTMAYISNFNDNTISVINTATNKVIASIPVGKNPKGITVSPTGAFVYVCNWGDSTLSVINTVSNSVTNTIKLNSAPYHTTVSGDGKMIYVTNFISNTVSVIDLTNSSLQATIQVGKGPMGIVMSPDSKLVYVANYFDGSVSVINTSTNIVTSTITVGPQAFGLAITPDGTKVLVSTYNYNGISIINTITGIVTTNIQEGNSPYGVGIIPNATKAYIPNSGDGTVGVFDMNTNKVIATIAVGNSPNSIGNFIANVPTLCGIPPPPTITSFKTTACPNTIDTVRGKGFKGASAVTFGGVAAKSFKVLNDTTIAAVVDSGASGKVTVTTPNGTASLAGFTYLKPTSSTTTQSICQGSTFTFSGTTYSKAGSYTTHLNNNAGCDSAATLVLTVKDTSGSTTNKSICQGSTFTFNGTTYSKAGSYTTHLTNSAGCDSAATLVLSVKDTSGSTTNKSICPSNSYTFNGKNYSSAGTYAAHLTNSVGCDSTATLVLTFTQPVTFPPIVGDTVVCINDSILLKDATIGGVWSSQNTSVATVDTFSGYVLGRDTGFVSISYNDTLGCSKPVTYTVDVLGEPINVYPIPINANCESAGGGSIPFDYIGGKESPYQVDYQGIKYSLPYTFTNLPIGSYSFTIYNRAGCKVETLPNEIIALGARDANCDTLYVPTAFVPLKSGNTGYTTVLKPYGGGISIQTINFIVYNRYGQLVFETHQLDNGWNGMINGVPQDAGTYVWILNYTPVVGKPMTLKGTSVLIR